MKHTKKLLAWLLAVTMLFGTAACGSSNGATSADNKTPVDTAQQGTADSTDSSSTPDSGSADTQEDYNGKLVSEGMMDIQYATQFSVEMFRGGYRMINNLLSDSRILVVPEGMRVPAGLDEDVQVLQLPVTNAYICGTNVVAMCVGIGAVDKVTLVGSDSKYHFDEVNAQLESGHTRFAGGYTTDLDYELVATSGTQVVVWNGTDDEVLEKLRDLGIVVVCEENTNEPNLYARMEWWKCLGVLLGVEEQANARFEEQFNRIEKLRTDSEPGIVVGMGGLSSSSGKYSTRKSGDFQADYIRYAGGTYNLQDVEEGSGGALTVTAEDFYLRFKDVDVLIWSLSGPTTMEELAELYPAIVDFKAYQNDRIYLQAKSYIQHSAMNPAAFVENVRTILTSEDTDVTTEYFPKLPWAADVAQ